MEIRSSKFKPRQVVVPAIFWIASIVLPGAVTPALADSDSMTGAIAGGFFADTMPLPTLEQLQRAVQMGPAPGAGSGLCEAAVASASASHQLPPGLLNAIAVVESGKPDPRTGTISPWPWTIDANGTGYMYGSAQAAIQAAAGFEAAGISSLDIGCLQVNLAQHPDAFQNLAQAFDPAANAQYAATFLTSLDQKFGNWPQAVAAYHSQTSALGEPYAQKVYAAWKGPDAGATAFAAVAGAAPPAITGTIQPAFAMSSFSPPTTMLNQPNRALTGRSLAAYRAAPVMMAARIPPQG